MAARLRRTKIPTPLIRGAQAVSVVSAVVKFYGLGVGAIAAGVVVTLARGVLHGWTLPLTATGVAMIVAAATMSALEKRRQRIQHEQGLDHTRFMTLMTSIRRRGSNIQPLPPSIDRRSTGAPCSSVRGGSTLRSSIA
jgi:hypothetical protein